jgi:ATP-dependent Clp protease ATP-binding subunit ClpC
VAPPRETSKPAPRARAVEVPLLPPVALHPPLHKALRRRDGGDAAKRATPSSKRAADELDPEECPLLVSLGKNLTRAARAGELEPVVGRDDEVEQALDILAKRHGNSPVLTGPAGVGKTSVARALAVKLGEAGKVLVELPVAELLAGTGARGALSERLADIRGEVRQAGGRVVLFIDELHELLEAGDEAVAELKTAMSSGELPLVGATSTVAFRRVVESDSALARRFTEVPIDEPGEADAFLLLRKVADALSKHHRVRYSDEAIAVAVSWSIRYLPGRALPDKAVGLLDLAGARRRRRVPEPDRRPRVDVEHVAEVVSELAAVPVGRLTQSDRERMLDLERLLAERVIGHGEACARIAAVLRRNAAGLRGARPVGTFLLLGPTGVGKTETAKAVAEVLFGWADALTRLDMSEYAEAHAVSRLVGAPPGYIGHEAGGLLTEAVRRRPYQVMLLDEIEKAHRDVLQTFLQVFDEGRLTDGRGRTVDFTNSVIVLTSNLGADELRSAMNEKRVGFGDRRPRDAANLRDVAIQAARAVLPPELYNRIDEVIFFRPLARDDVRAIARKLLAALAGALGARNIRLDVEPAALDALLDSGGGFDAELGARPMRRAISRLVEAPIADMLLRGDLHDGATALVTADNGEVVIRRA